MTSSLPSRRRAGKASLVVLLLFVLAGGGAALVGALADDVPPPLPADPAARPVGLLYARPYVLEQAETFAWRAERPQVRGGVALVLAVDPDLVYPRQVEQPVLQVGAQTAERVNHGNGSGHVVALVPAPVGADGRVQLDLASTPVFFGEPALPDTLDAAALAERLERARADGVLPPAADTVASVLEQPVTFRDGWELRVWAADLVEAWAPDEADLVAGLRAPRLTR